MKYRKKPIVIEAVQFDGKNFKEVGSLCGPGGNKFTGLMVENGVLFVRTLEGILRVKEGDWIIRGVKGELYPCKPDIFAATYEAVPE